MLFRNAILFAIVGLLIYPLSGFSAAAQSETNSPISRSPQNEAGNGDSRNPSLSADGRFIVYESVASNLVPGDTNLASDIFIFDRQLGQTDRINVTPQGAQANSGSYQPEISGNGRFVAFESDATNLVDGDTNQHRDIFTYDRLTQIIRRVSIGVDGHQANADSQNVTISFDGRYLAFESLASNLVRGDHNASVDILIFDQVTAHVMRASGSGPGIDANAGSHSPAISGDGRLVAYVSEADNLVPGDTNGSADVFVFHRVLQQVERVSVSTTGAQLEPASGGPDISFTGRNVTFTSAATIPAAENLEGLKIYRRDRQAATTYLAQAFSDEVSDIHARLSADGLEIVFLEILAGNNRLRRGATGGLLETIAEGDIGTGFDVSDSGGVLAFEARPDHSSDPFLQVYALPQAATSDVFFIAGRVTDAIGEPLALVTITDSNGVSTRTDAGGYFYLSGYPAGPVTLTAEKEGYAFEPPAWNLSIFRDVAGYLFKASNEELLLEEARRDLGMPYSFNRGCASGEEPCGGPYHGFHAGFCTDLILDAYTYALDFDIDFALEHDAYAHPEHFYRWRNARNTHDMWRYFHYSGQMLPHEQDYLPGDIVFFDWSGDGEIDHVSLVSGVSSGRPVKMVDATGVIDQNPSGLAAELDWLPFHESTVRGHARWSGQYEPIQTGFRPGTQVLQMALAGSDVFLRLTDEAGRAISFGEQSILDGSYFDLDWEEVISVLEPQGAYTIEIRAAGDRTAPYQFTVQTLTDGVVTARVTADSIARPLEVRRIGITVAMDADGNLSLQPDFGSRQAKVRGLLRKK